MRTREIRLISFHPLPLHLHVLLHGVQFEQRLLRGKMQTAFEFFKLFFTVELANDVVEHTKTAMLFNALLNVPMKVTLKRMDDGRTQHRMRYTA